MANSDENFDPAFNHPLPPEFLRWSLGLDFDDEEFRAGYPFSDVPEIEPNENWQSHDSLSTSDHDEYELGNSDGVDGYISTTTSSFEQQEKEDIQLKSDLTNENCENQSMNSNELHNYIEEKQNSDHQCDCVDQKKEININEFHLTNEDCENQSMNSNELHNYIEEKQNSDHQYIYVDQEKEININKFEPLDQIEENEEVVKNSM